MEHAKVNNVELAYEVVGSGRLVGATHLLQMQAPRPVAAAIAAFLERTML